MNIDVQATTDAVMGLIEGSGIPREEAERCVRAGAETWSDDVIAFDVIVTLNGEPLLPALSLLPINRPTLRARFCTCGSGAHPRPCVLHPEAFSEHVAELNRENEAANAGDD